MTRRSNPSPVVIPDIPISERIAGLKDAIRMARYNARIARQEGDAARSMAAYDRAHDYVGRIRVLREYADGSQA